MLRPALSQRENELQRSAGCIRYVILLEYVILLTTAWDWYYYCHLINEETGAQRSTLVRIQTIICLIPKVLTFLTMSNSIPQSEII